MITLADTTIDTSSSNGNGGDINLLANGNINISNGKLDSSSFSLLGNGGAIDLDAGGMITLSDTTILSQDSTTAKDTRTGDINIMARSLFLANGSAIDTENFSAGEGNNVMITVSDTVSLTQGSRINTSNISATGNAGDVTITAGNTVYLEGLNSGVFSDAIFSEGDGGNININTDSLFIKDGAGLNARTVIGAGKAGNVKIKAQNIVFLDDGTVSTLTASEQKTAKGGDIDIQTRLLTVKGGAELLSLTAGAGKAGDIRVQATDSVIISGFKPAVFEPRAGGIEFQQRSGLFAWTAELAAGNAGNVTINTPQLTIKDGARISTETLGPGDAGNIEINAADSVSVKGGSFLQSGTAGQGNGGNITIAAGNTVSFDGDSFASSEVARSPEVGLIGRGKGGDITIETGSFFVTNGGDLTTFTGGEGEDAKAGNIIIRADDRVVFAGENSLASTSVGFEVVGEGGDIDIQARSLTVAGGARLLTSTLGAGESGDIRVHATDSVIISGSETQDSLLFAGTGDLIEAPKAIGAGGTIDVKTGTLSISEGGALSALSQSLARGGDVFVTADTLEITGRGRITTTAFSSGKAGDISLKVKDSITLAGVDSGLFANTETDSTGDGGSIFIDPRTVIIRDGASVAVNSEGNGQGGDIEILSESLSLDNGQILADSKSDIEIGIGGNIEIVSGSLTLDNEAEISSDTDSTNGGNITLEIDDDPLLLRRQSSISTDAGTELAGGDGGNITINAPFIIAFPSEDSDITANAYLGNGGRIQITTQGIFGIEFRDIDTSLSDFTVSSELGESGTFATEGLLEENLGALITLPEETVNTEISQGCQTVRGREAVEYFDIGRGGVRPTPYDPLNADEAIEDWIDLESESENGSDSGTNINSPYPAKTQLILSCPAQSE